MERHILDSWSFEKKSLIERNGILLRIVGLRDWSLITGIGGATKREGGGHVKFYPYEKGGGEGAEKSFSHAGGGHTKF